MTYDAVKLAAFVACWFARLRRLVFACAELAEVFGGEGVGFAEEVDLDAPERLTCDGELVSLAQPGDSVGERRSDRVSG